MIEQLTKECINTKKENENLHKQARAYAEKKVLSKVDNGKGNNDIYNNAYDYFLDFKARAKEKETLLNFKFTKKYGLEVLRVMTKESEVKK